MGPLLFLSLVELYMTVAFSQSSVQCLSWRLSDGTWLPRQEGRAFDETLYRLRLGRSKPDQIVGCKNCFVYSLWKACSAVLDEAFLGFPPSGFWKIWICGIYVSFVCKFLGRLSHLLRNPFLELKTHSNSLRAPIGRISTDPIYFDS